MKKVKWSRYRPGVSQRALLLHDRGTRRGWVVSSTPRPHFTPGKDPVPILQEAGWAPGPVCTRGKSRPYRDSMPDNPACSQSLYWLSYPAHNIFMYSSSTVRKISRNVGSSYNSRRRKGPQNQFHTEAPECWSDLWNSLLSGTSCSVNRKWYIISRMERNWYTL